MSFSPLQLSRGERSIALLPQNVSWCISAKMLHYNKELSASSLFTTGVPLIWQTAGDPAKIKLILFIQQRRKSAKIESLKEYVATQALYGNLAAQVPTFHSCSSCQDPTKRKLESLLIILCGFYRQSAPSAD